MRVTLTQPRNEMSLVGCKGIQGAWAGVPMYHTRVLNTLVSNPNITFTAARLVAISNAICHESNSVINGCQMPYNIFCVTRLPTKCSEIKKMYFEGKYAIIPNLPSPSSCTICVTYANYQPLHGIWAWKSDLPP